MYSSEYVCIYIKNIQRNNSMYNSILELVTINKKTKCSNKRVNSSYYVPK